MSSSPTSSPASSPSFGPSDSSPPSSPNLGPIGTPSTFGSPGLSHPYAASTKAIKRPKIYERRENGGSRSSGTPPAGEESDPKRVRARTRAQSTASSADASPLIHPYAASAKPSWKPPRREAKYRRVDSAASASSAISGGSEASSHMAIEPLRLNATPSEDDSMHVLTEDEGIDIFSTGWNRYRLSAEEMRAREKRVWDAAITKAIDDANGIIDLSQSGYSQGLLTHIPPSISDLAGLVVLKHGSMIYSPPPTQSPPRRFARSLTFPALSGTMGGLAHLEKAASFTYNHVEASVARSVNEVQLYLAGNSICKLPLGLFTLQGLTVLSLRANSLRTIPPQIAKLVNLRELNLARNHLSWLPSEMLNMNIPKLTLTSNPWLPIPADTPAKTKPVSETTVHFRIATLTEMCLRVLLGPAGTGMKETALELYELPLNEVEFSSEMRTVLSSCVPGSVARPAPQDDDGMSSHSLSSTKWEVFSTRTGHTDAATADYDVADPLDIGVCPSPRHRTQDEEWVRGRKPVFVRWGEERFTWEKLGGAETALVPVRWRGCGRGCLDFLNGSSEEERMKEVEEDPDGFIKSDNDPASTSGVQVVDVGAGVGDWTDEEFS